MRIFIDDIRLPIEVYNYMKKKRIGEGANEYREEWTIVHNYDEFVACLKEFGGSGYSLI